jgi:hypothetical protein
MSSFKSFAPYFPVCMFITAIVAIGVRMVPTAQQMSGPAAIQTGIAAALIFVGAATMLKRP